MYILEKVRKDKGKQTNRNWFFSSQYNKFLISKKKKPIDIQWLDYQTENEPFSYTCDLSLRRLTFIDKMSELDLYT